MDVKTFVRASPPLFTLFVFTLLVAIPVQGAIAPLSADDSGATDTALFLAIRMDDLSAVKTALQRGANVNAPSEEGETPLMYAAVYSTAGCMKLLLGRGANPNARDKRGGTALMRSVRDVARVRLLLDHGADVDALSDLRIRPLMVAANTAGASEVVKLLLARKADPNTPEGRGITPLIYGAESGDVETVKALVAAGADVNSPATGPTPVIVAAERPVEVLSWLLSHKANPNAGRQGGRTPLMMAAAAGATDNVKALLDWGADVNAKSNRGTALMYAAGSDRAGEATVRLLLDHGADPTIIAQRCDRCIHEPRADDGTLDLTALMLAKQRGDTTIVRLLVAAGATR